jgi:hypothetical protein
VGARRVSSLTKFSARYFTLSCVPSAIRNAFEKKLGTVYEASSSIAICGISYPTEVAPGQPSGKLIRQAIGRQTLTIGK